MLKKQSYPILVVQILEIKHQLLVLLEQSHNLMRLVPMQILQLDEVQQLEVTPEIMR